MQERTSRSRQLEMSEMSYNINSAAVLLLSAFPIAIIAFAIVYNILFLTVAIIPILIIAGLVLTDSRWDAVPGRIYHVLAVLFGTVWVTYILAFRQSLVTI